MVKEEPGAAEASDAAERKRAEEALRRREQELRVIADNVPALFSYLDADGHYRFVNRRYEEWFGVPRTQIVGKHYREVLGEATYEQIENRVEKVLSGQPVSYEEALPYAHGGTRWVIAEYVPDSDDQGMVRGFFALVTDITERKRAEEALRASEEKYRRLLESLQEGIWAIDKDACTTFVNDRMAEMLGYTVDEMQGKHLFSFMDECGREIAKRNLERRRQGIKEQHDFEFVRKDGTRLYTTLETSPLTDDDGNYVGAIAGVIDITERKRAEEALQESEERFRRLSESAFEGIVIHDKGRILDGNQAFVTMFGYELPEAIGMHATEFVAPEYRDLITQRVLSGYREPFQALGMRKDGSTFPGVFRAKPIPYQGRMISVAVMRDITELKEAEEALQKAREELECRVERRMERGNPYSLTFRELTVLHLVAAGRADKEIGIELGISPQTAQKHVANILSKMSAACRTEAGVRAVREGLLD